MCQNKEQAKENGGEITKKNCGGKCQGMCRFVNESKIVTDKFDGSFGILADRHRTLETPVQQNTQSITP